MRTASSSRSWVTSEKERRERVTQGSATGVHAGVAPPDYGFAISSEIRVSTFFVDQRQECLPLNSP